MDVTVSDPMLGRLLDGRYHVGRRIARGGMATVYEAVDTRLHRTVAVKVLHAGLTDDADFVRRFQREARSAARLSHPNVVAMFDQGEDDGTPYLTMEYVAGHTLRQAMNDRGRFDPTTTLEILDYILQALAAAHGADLVHRDVKPENVLIAPDGAIKVADFGLARAVSNATSTATQGLLIGTISYLAPEQVTHGAADARADVYATGIVLYELLVGAKPHSGDSPIQVAYQHVNEDVPAPSLVVPGLPSYIDGLVMRATARDPQVRPADARVLLHHVRRARSALAQGVDDQELTQDLLAFRREGDPSDPGYGHGQDRGQDHGQDQGQGRAQAPLRLAEHTLIAPFEPIRPTRSGSPPAHRAGGPSMGGPYAEDEDPEAARFLPWWRRTSMIAGAAALVLLLAAGGCWLAAVGPFTRVPSFKGVTESELVTLGQESGLHFQVTKRTYSERFGKGQVMSFDPAPPARTFRGGTVEVLVSRGPERHPVPSLAGMPEERARELLANSGLRVADVNRIYSDDVGDGRVISCSPPPGTSLRRNQAVTLVVSSGPEPVAIPSVVGATLDQANAALTPLGLDIKSSEQFSDTVPKGVVISQDPGPGQGHRGDRITLAVSRGPEFVPVPVVVAQNDAAATKALEDAGFKVQVNKSPSFVNAHIVVGQTPPGGQTARVGSTVVIEIV